MHALFPSGEPIRPPMVYLEEPLDESELNTLGEDGRELAGVAQHSPFAYDYFKRPTET